MSGASASPTCDRCGAALPVGTPGAVLTCAYCGGQTRAPDPPAVEGGPVQKIVLGPGRSIELHGNRIELRGKFRSPSDIQEELADKRREEADRLRTARIYAAVLSVIFLVVLGTILVVMR